MGIPYIVGLVAASTGGHFMTNTFNVRPSSTVGFMMFMTSSTSLVLVSGFKVRKCVTIIKGPQEDSNTLSLCMRVCRIEEHG